MGTVTLKSEQGGGAGAGSGPEGQRLGTGPVRGHLMEDDAAGAGKSW